jgi:hypothetical protein
MRSLIVAASLASCALSLLAAAPVGRTPARSAPSRKADAYADWTFLSQNWSREVRENFYLTTQGSELVPYDWFFALEQPGNRAPFTEDLGRYGFLPGPDSPRNPDHLPLGFVRNDDSRVFGGVAKKSWVGLTCAACHTGGITYRKSQSDAPVNIIIDGAPSLGDFGAFMADLAASIAQTNADPDAFDRFAHQVLQDNYSPAAAANLKTQFRQFAANFARLDACSQVRDPWGPGRIDAFGVIFNSVCSLGLNMPGNYAPPNAPVSLPFLWNIHRQDKIQWFGEVPNVSLLDHLARNSGEVLGVFAKVDVTPGTVGYRSTVHRINMLWIEHWLGSLQAPKWPADALGAIDATKLARGRQLYRDNCLRCHMVLQPGSSVMTMIPTPLNEVGTDGLTTQNVHQRMVKTGPLQGRVMRSLSPFAPRFGATASAADVVAHVVFKTLVYPGADIPTGLGLAGLGLKKTDMLDSKKLAASSAQTAGITQPGYEARPLNGIWATAPYLHNGSVASLYQLLLPPAQRLKQFNVGTHEFDPVNVGYRTDPSYGGRTFNTALMGDSNAGHSYGTTMSDADRWALVEYLKTL